MNKTLKDGVVEYVLGMGRKLQTSRAVRILVSKAEYCFMLPGMVLVLGGPAILFFPQYLNVVLALLSFSVGIPCIYAAIRFVSYKRAAEEALKQIQASILIQAVSPTDDQLAQIHDLSDEKVTMH